MTTTVTWPTTSGSLTLELCKFGVGFHPNPGVYIFCRPAATAGKWDPIYVGECENFNERLNTNLPNHHRWSCIQRERATNVCVLRVDGGKLKRTAVETDLRQKLDPPCNRQ